MKRWSIVLAVLGCLVASAALYFRSGADDLPPAQPEPAAETATVSFLMEQQWLIGMKLALVERSSVARQIASTGRVVPAFRHYALVAPPISGILAGDGLPRVGQRVTKGAVLARVLDSPESRSLETARAMLEIEKMRIEAEKRRLTEQTNEARARMLLAITEADHAQRLFERKAYSLNQYQKAQHELKVAETDYDAAKRQLEALAAIEIPELPGDAEEQDEHPVRSPLSGTVVKLHKQVGERVGAGEPILEIVDLRRVWVEAPVFERDLSKLDGDVRASFTTSADPSRRFEGKLVDVGALVDERTRAATVLFEIENSDGFLRIGMQANVAIETGETIDAFLLPREAIVEVEGRPHVYVLRTGEEFERRPVKVAELAEFAALAGEKAVVLEGVEPGERVVTRGAHQIYLQELTPSRPGAHTHE